MPVVTLKKPNGGKSSEVELGVEFGYTRVIQYTKTDQLLEMQNKILKQLQEAFQQHYKEAVVDVLQQSLLETITDHTKSLQKPTHKKKTKDGKTKYYYPPEISHLLKVQKELVSSTSFRFDVDREIHLPWMRVIVAVHCKLFTPEQVLAHETIELGQDQYATRKEKPQLREWVLNKALKAAGYDIPKGVYPIVDFEKNLKVPSCDLPITPSEVIFSEAEEETHFANFADALLERGFLQVS
jgi:hypothetical protein